MRALHAQDAHKCKRLLSREGTTCDLDVKGSTWQDHFLSDLARKLLKLSIISQSKTKHWKEVTSKHILSSLEVT